MFKRMAAVSLLTLLVSSQVFAAREKKDVVGTIEDVTLGEISMGIGDACIFSIETEERKSVALIVDFDECAEAELYNIDLTGKRIQVPAEALRLIDDEGTLRLYKELDSSYFYMFSNFKAVFGGIQN